MLKRDQLFLMGCLAVIMALFLLISSPAKAGGVMVHRVESGESLFSVARSYEVTLDDLLHKNSYIRFPDRIFPGQVLIIPEPQKPGIKNQDDKPVSMQPADRSTRESQSIAPLSRIYSDRFYLSGSVNAHNMVALTFDDGPDAAYTPLVLDVLREYNVPATFFLIGQNIQRYPEVVQRIKDEGHIIGNHSWSHPRLSETPPHELTAEIEKTEEKLEAITGLRTMLMRPPYGSINSNVLEQLIALDYYIINWSVDSVDWRDQDVDQILINTLPDVRDGAIMLFHSTAGANINPKATALALPELIETLRMQDYTFVTVDELLNIPPYR